MATMNILGMSQSARQELAAQAGRELATGDDRLARRMLLAAAQQLAARSRHHADEILTLLETLRRSVAVSGTYDEAIPWKSPNESPNGSGVILAREEAPVNRAPDSGMGRGCSGPLLEWESGPQPSR